jgi:hypothetical protein
MSVLHSEFSSQNSFVIANFLAGNRTAGRYGDDAREWLASNKCRGFVTNFLIHLMIRNQGQTWSEMRLSFVDLLLDSDHCVSISSSAANRGIRAPFLQTRRPSKQHRCNPDETIATAVRTGGNSSTK